MNVAHVAHSPDLAKYRLLDEIGHGGMATVYRAKDVRLDREVAVKLIHPHLRDNAEVASRFITEARAVAKLKHTGIVEIFDVSDESDEERFLVAELVRGPSLRKILRDHEQMPAEIGACFGVLLCEALGHAHDAGIVHRDVKPENVLVELDDQAAQAHVKLTDFGIAKVLDSEGVTSTGQVLGSPAHMAPEQIEGEEVDPRTDVFGLGVLVYECMVGHLPFEGKNPAQILRKVLDCVYPAPDKERPTVGACWAQVVQKAIARLRTERYDSVRQFEAALRQGLAEAEIQDPCAEIYRYLSSPEGYLKTFEPQMVQRLMKLADAARRRGDVTKAAAHLNRAVAYAPENAELLRMITHLARGSHRKRLALQVAVVLGSVLAVGAASFGVVRAVRASRAPEQRAQASGLSSLELFGLQSSASETTAAGASSGALSLSPVASRGLVSPGPHAPLVIRGLALQREVRITANPGSALVSIDGEAPTKINFYLLRKLSVGTHTLVFSVDKSSSCCDSATMNVEVRADDGKGQPQEIHGRLRYRDAILSLAGGPTDARLHCPEILADIGTGTQFPVKMSDAERRVSCFIDGTGIAPAERQVELRAGQLHVEPFPSSP